MDPFHSRGKRILFAVLNWGLGHASRSHKLIRELSKNNQVVIASDGNALSWLRSEFHDMEYVELPELRMSYSKRFGAIGGIIKKLPHFLTSIRKDQKAIVDLLKNDHFDFIISDNRYGVYREEIPSYLISHQLRLMSPLSEILQFPLYNLIEKFDEVWVPDDEKRSTSGLLSLPENELRIPIKYIGPLSRFSNDGEQNKDIRFLLIASGPEPHRSQFVNYFEANFSLLDVECHIIAGDISREKYQKNKLFFHPSADSHVLENLIKRSEYVICRSGYSSILDLIELDQKAILIPTPGQAEQEYLAQFHINDPRFTCVLNAKELSSIMKSLI